MELGWCAITTTEGIAVVQYLPSEEMKDDEAHFSDNNIADRTSALHQRISRTQIQDYY
jgi:hypothetical protein